MILISLEPWDLVNEVWTCFCTKWVYKSSDLTHDICLYLKNIINLCTDSTAKAHRDRGLCVVTGNSQGAKVQKGDCCNASGEFLERSMRAHIAFQMHQSCCQHSCERIGTGRAWTLQAGPLDLCRQGTAAAAPPTSLPGRAGRCVQILQMLLGVCGWACVGQFRQAVTL